LSAAAITKTGSEGMSEMVGPAASTSVGVFSCAYICEEDELWLEELCLDEELPEDWATPSAEVRPANRKKRAATKSAEDCNGRGVMKETLSASLFRRRGGVKRQLG